MTDTTPDPEGHDPDAWTAEKQQAWDEWQAQQQAAAAQQAAWEQHQAAANAGAEAGPAGAIPAMGAPIPAMGASIPTMAGADGAGAEGPTIPPMPGTPGAVRTSGSSSVPVGVIVAAVVVILGLFAGFMIYSTSQGTTVGSWLAKTYPAADPDTRQKATDAEATHSAALAATSTIPSVVPGLSEPTIPTTTTTVADDSEEGMAPPAGPTLRPIRATQVPDSTTTTIDPTATVSPTGTTPRALGPSAMYTSDQDVATTAAAIGGKFSPNSTQSRDGRQFLEYEEAVVAVVPALIGGGSLIFVDTGDSGYRRWGAYTGAAWGLSRAGRSFSSGGGVGGFFGGGGGSSGGGGK